MGPLFVLCAGVHPGECEHFSNSASGRGDISWSTKCKTCHNYFELFHLLPCCLKSQLLCGAPSSTCSQRKLRTRTKLQTSSTSITLLLPQQPEKKQGTKSTSWVMQQGTKSASWSCSLQTLSQTLLHWHGKTLIPLADHSSPWPTTYHSSVWPTTYHSSVWPTTYHSSVWPTTSPLGNEQIAIQLVVIIYSAKE
ncbi:uncharacterized protein ACBT44_003593 [Syngnathus typhle]